MATLGIKNVKLALVDKTGTVITGANGIFKDAKDTSGIFTADQDTAKGIATVALSGLTGTITPVWGSDVIVYQSAGKGTPSSVLTINDLPNVIKQAILGNVLTTKGGYKISGKANPNNLVAFLAESREAFDDDAPVYVGMYMGTASEATTTMGTSNANDVRNTDVITISGIERGEDGFGAHWFSDSATFKEADMLADVFKTATKSGSGTSGQ